MHTEATPKRVSLALRLVLPGIMIAALATQWFLYKGPASKRALPTDRVFVFQEGGGLTGVLVDPETPRPGNELAVVTFWWQDRAFGLWAKTVRQRGMVMGFRSYSDQLGFNSNGVYTEDELRTWLYTQYPSTRPVVETARELVEASPFASLSRKQLRTPAKNRPRPLGYVENMLSVCMLAALLVCAIAEIKGVIRRKAHAKGTCLACGYSLEGLPSPTCPECGAQQPAQPDASLPHN